MLTKEKTKPVESQETQPVEIFLLELENRSVKLKIGTHKFDMLNILGTDRGVEVLNKQELWYYRFSVNGKTLYCALTFVDGLLHSIKTTHK